ncbi:adenylate/guanylate cyclase domain-containing protein, partial [Salmonella enterica subsp. enterica]|nr:adenylate/guanylate cyclase domain-containing protein [Salmonella enterica subsp. enterica serovar Enteritidis]
MSEEASFRQLATICAIDAVGFSKLMNADVEVALSVFESRRKLIDATIEEHGGNVFGAAGDSVMAEFFNPVEAIRASLSFQDKVDALNDAQREAGAPTMQFRVGMATGVVVHRGSAIYGDCVNISARLQEFAPPGGIAISEVTQAHLNGRILAEMTDMGPMNLKNIPLPVRVYLVSKVVGRSAAAHAAAIRAALRADGGDEPTLSGIAVLPFEDSEGHTEDQYLGDGIAEELIHGLAATRSIPVISRSSSFQFRDKSLGVQIIGRLLGARYLVTGGVHNEDGRIRVSASLSDSSSGHVVWSARFEREMGKLVELQGELGGEIVSALEREVDRMEQVRSFQVPWEKLATWQLVRRGRWHMQRRTREDTERAFELFMQAYAEDPYSTSVLNELGWWHLWRAWLNFANRADLAKVADYAQRALLVDSQNAQPYTLIGFSEILRGDPQSATNFLAQALHYNPSFAPAYQAMGSALLLLSRCEEAIERLKRADTLSPYEHYRFHTLGEMTSCYFVLQDWPKALSTGARSLTLAQDYFYPRFLRIGALVLSDQPEAARKEHADFQLR